VSANGGTDYVGFCSCGCIATASCNACGTPLCHEHARTYPETPQGVSEYAQIEFARAVRLVGGIECESCRAEKGRLALERAVHVPLEPLPDHWLDRAIALRTDQTRSPDEKSDHGGLPMNLSSADVIAEFVRRIDKAPAERAKILEGGLFSKPEYVHGWKINCQRREYTQRYPDGSTERHPLPVLLTPEREILGPPDDADEQNLVSSVWGPVYENEIDLTLLVSGCASILMLSRFAA
jgi:hypothetical protein